MGATARRHAYHLIRHQRRACMYRAEGLGRAMRYDPIDDDQLRDYESRWRDDLPQRIDRKEMENNQCSQCREFFARFSCSKAVHLECDCPKCMGLCECITTQRGERR